MHTYRKEPAAPARILSPGLEEAGRAPAPGGGGGGEGTSLSLGPT